MAKKKTNYVILAAAIAGLLLGAAQLGYNLVAHSMVAILAALLGAYMLYLAFAQKKGQLDWTVVVAGLVYIAHYMVAPETIIGGNIDLHASLMLSAGVAGLILLTTRAEVF